MDAKSLIAVVWLLGCIAGCNNSEPSQTATAAEGVSAEVKPTNDKLAVLLPRESGTFHDAVRDGVASAAEEYKVEVEFMPYTAADAGEQETLLGKAVEEAFRGICIYPSAEMVEPINEAIESKIPLVVFGRDLTGQVDAVSIATTDQFHCGRSVAEFLAKSLKKDDKVLLIASAENPEAAARLSGFEYASEKELEMFSVLTSEGTDEAISKALEDEDIQAVVAFDIPGSQLALESLDGEEFNERDLIVCGFGSWNGTEEAVRNGELDAVMLEDPYMIGYSAVMAMANHLSEEEVGDFITTGEHVITAETLDAPNSLRLLESNRSE